jgi:predicted NUDIX family NTP pyrophosphohydrolase
MAQQRSAGVLLYRYAAGELRVLLVHPGGPYWRRRDERAWQLPKGAIEPGEKAEAAARREAEEELGLRLAGELQPLGEVRQAGGKLVVAYALEQEFDPAAIVSNRFELEWPRGSGKLVSFPEVDAARWMSLAEAGRLMLPSQQPLLAQLVELLAPNGGGEVRFPSQ